MWRRDDANPALVPFLDTVRSEARRLTAQGGFEAEPGVSEPAVSMATS